MFIPISITWNYIIIPKSLNKTLNESKLELIWELCWKLIHANNIWSIDVWLIFVRTNLKSFKNLILIDNPSSTSVVVVDAAALAHTYSLLTLWDFHLQIYLSSYFSLFFFWVLIFLKSNFCFQLLCSICKYQNKMYSINFLSSSSCFIIASTFPRILIYKMFIKRVLCFIKFVATKIQNNNRKNFKSELFTVWTNYILISFDMINRKVDGKVKKTPQWSWDIIADRDKC